MITLRDIKIELSRREFWEYCKTREPEFYKESRPHLKRLCTNLGDFYENKLLKENGDPYSKLMIRLPPQHGKSRTLVNFTQWVLGKNNEERIITGSYGDAPASDFARYTRDGINEVSNTPDQIVFSDIFPGTIIKRGNASVQKWALEGQHFNYLGVGYGGGVTGKGATLRIIDDIVKDAEVALNQTALEKIWRWLSGTFSSRNSAEGGVVKEIFCATLWGENDPQAILERTEGDEWYVISMPIYDRDTATMLCDDFMNLEAFEKLKKRMLVDSRTKMIFYANYMCEAIDDNEAKAFARSSIQTYKEIPTEIITEGGVQKEVQQGRNFAAIDPADEGEDNFAMPIVRVIGNYIYLTDVIFNQNNLTTQLPEIASKIKCNDRFERIVVETNNVGAWLARHLVEQHPEIEFFSQWSKAQKMSRILTMAGLIKLYLRVPDNPTPDVERFMNQVYKLLKTSKKEDDAPDSLALMFAHLESHYGLFRAE